MEIAPHDAVTQATRDEIIAYGIRRATMASIAKRAGISRATLYRRAGTMDELVRDALVSELAPLATVATVSEGSIYTRTALVDSIIRGLDLLLHDELFAAIIDHDPELLLPYLVDRLGRSQELLVETLASAIHDAQGNGEVRQGDPHVLALGCLQSLTGFVVGRRFLSSSAAEAIWLKECAHLIDGYLAPKHGGSGDDAIH